MSTRLRRHPWRWTLLAAVLMATAAGALLARRVEPAYVAGERTEGLTDSLGRKIPDDRPRVTFADVTAQAGIRFRHFPFTRTNRLPEDMGSGVALGDADGDGWTDVFLVNEGHTLDPSALDPRAVGDARGDGRCALFRNRGDGTFEDVSRSAGVDLDVLGMGAAFLDVDSDGDLDLLVTCFGELRLLRNDGRGHFEDVTAAAHLSELHGFWTGIAVGDYDRDGAIDIYVCGYVQYTDGAVAAEPLAKQYDTDIPARINPSAFPPERNLLLRNRGDGSFEERAEFAGVANPQGRSLGATFADLNGDGWPDIYVANDVSNNAFFVNRGDGTFEDRSTEAQVADYRGAMGLAVGDFDGDLDLDFLVTHWVGQENALYVNYSRPKSAEDPLGREMFFDMADRFGLGAPTIPDVGWATGFFDYDNDGTLDLFVIDGSTIPLQQERTRLAPQKSHLFWNAGGRRGFFDVGAASGSFFESEHVGRGGATFDYDLDGDEDLFVTVHGASPHLLRNDGGSKRPSVLVRLRQPSGNRFAIGAKVAIEMRGRETMAELDTQGSYLSQHAVGEVSFGLGDADAIDRLRVTWPDGAQDEACDVPAGTLVTWTRGSAPIITPLPGRARAAQPAALGVEDQRRFFALLERASEKRLAGDHSAALASYAEALKISPGHADCLYYTANCLAELGRAAEAQTAFETFVQQHPEESRGWMQVGATWLARPDRTAADLDRAESAFRRALAINGEESLPVLRLGTVALLRGNQAEADDLFARAAVLNAQSIEARWFRGCIAWQRGEPARATALLSEARAIAAKKAEASKAVLHEGGTKSGAAMTAVARAEATDPLLRWRSVLDRSGDPRDEYGDFSGVGLR